MATRTRTRRPTAPATRPVEGWLVLLGLSDELVLKARDIPATASWPHADMRTPAARTCTFEQYRAFITHYGV